MSGINLVTNFNVQTGLPLDARQIVGTVTARNAITQRYEGLSVYVQSEGKRFILLGGTTDDNWVSEERYGPDIAPPSTVRYAMVATAGEEVYAYSSSTVYGNLSWIRTGTVLRVMRNSHNLVAGDRVFVRNTNQDVIMATVVTAATDYFEIPTLDSGVTNGWKGAYGIGFNYAHDVTGANKLSGTLSRPVVGAGELYLHTLSIRPGASRADTIYTVHLPSETLSSGIITSVAGTTDTYILPTFQVRRVDGGIAPYTVITVVNGNTFTIGGSDENLRINIHF